MSKEQKCQLFEDAWNAVYGDSWEWLIIWGPPRCSKTTLAGWILHSLYKNWDKVLDAFGYNLPQILYKIQHGIPERWPTANGLHMRVPALNWDDFGAYSNKAVTQYQEAWDHIKGGFDILGTKVGVLIATMVDPLEPTFQIQNKYTHEIQILDKGVYKYDKVEWQQDFKGWKPRAKKIFIEKNTFDPWPDEVYKTYDTTRCSLADEIFQRIDDATIMGNVEWTVKMCKPTDFKVLSIIDERGPIPYDVFDQFGDEGKKALLRLKARCLLVAVNMGKGYYKYDMTPLGKSVLEAHFLPQSNKDSSSTQPSQSSQQP